MFVPVEIADRSFAMSFIVHGTLKFTFVITVFAFVIDHGVVAASTVVPTKMFEEDPIWANKNAPAVVDRRAVDVSKFGKWTKLVALS